MGISRCPGGSALVLCQSLGAKPSVEKPAPPVVEIAPVEQRDVPVYGEWIGTLAGQVNANVKAQVSGYLLRRTTRKDRTSRRATSFSR